jgi:hypothetical protein
MTEKKTPVRKAQAPSVKPRITRPPAKKPNVSDAPKTKASAKPRTAKKPSFEKKAKPLPVPDAPDHDKEGLSMDAELLALDAANMVGCTDFDDLPTNDKFAFLDCATPFTASKINLKGTILTAALGLVAGILIGVGVIYPRGYSAGMKDGERLAYLTVSITGMQQYLQCVEKTPTCSKQQAIALWAKALADGNQAGNQAEADEATPELTPRQ